MTATRADAVLHGPAGHAETFVVFGVDGVRYALPVAAVQRTLPFPMVTRLPAVESHVLGVFQYAGRVITLWDLHALFAASADPPQTPWVVVTEEEGRLLGLAVGRVEDVVTVDGWALAHGAMAHDPAAPAVRGVLVPLQPEAAEAGEDPGPLEERPPTDRGAEQLFSLHPVHLLDLAALRRLGIGEVSP